MERILETNSLEEVTKVVVVRGFQDRED